MRNGADFAAIAPNAGTTSFAGTHNHYLGTSSFSGSNVNTLIQTVVEHSPAKGLALYINYADKTTFTTAVGATYFKSPSNPNFIYHASDESVAKLDIEADPENQLVGWAYDIPVYTKPWAIANFIVCLATDGVQKPLAFRQRKQTALQGLRISSEIPNLPLVAKEIEAEFGIGAYGRQYGAILDTKNSSYTAPTIS